MCEQEASNFQSRRQLRAEEFEAAAKAIEIISGSAVMGSGKKHLLTCVQVKKTNSRVFPMIAEKVSLEHLKKVKKMTEMVKDFIYRSMEDAGEEATREGWKFPFKIYDKQASA